MAAKQRTEGQQTRDALRRYFRIGPNTPYYRRGEPHLRGRILDAVENSVRYPGYFTPEQHEHFNRGYVFYLAWNKHVSGYRLGGPTMAALRRLTPWWFTQLVGDFIDAGISNVGQAEGWLPEWCDRPDGRPRKG